MHTFGAYMADTCLMWPAGKWWVSDSAGGVQLRGGQPMRSPVTPVGAVRTRAATSTEEVGRPQVSDATGLRAPEVETAALEEQQSRHSMTSLHTAPLYAAPRHATALDAVPLHAAPLHGAPSHAAPLPAARVQAAGPTTRVGSGVTSGRSRRQRWIPAIVELLRRLPRG
ncbi:hypothetical protein Raf01_44900 [Rugosimonospora africana]|uniref:Uncharacterized protein n=1 Tax=Rugosimonospora africana TaxID=556532 RepID=A0A8J3VSC6_9ACTN|nr:hypothetical protein Raf01_44900 [Rugosimonospora africana]